MKRQPLKKIILVWIVFIVFNQRSFAMAQLDQIRLPSVETVGEISLEEVIAKRRSERSFLNKDLDLKQIGQLLWAAQGITGKVGGYSFRSAPSAGALYPMELFVFTSRGVFHYVPQGHYLKVTSKKDLRAALTSAALGQDAVKHAPISIVITAIYQRVTQKYGERGMQYVHIEAGHIAQNIHLQAVALNLSSVPIGAFKNEAIKKVLGEPAHYEPLYIIPVGYADK